MHTLLLLLTISRVARPAKALVARNALPPQFTVTPIGPQTSNFGSISRDGGGGGSINGKNILLFCDTISSSNFSSNTATYADALNPAFQTDFGENGNPWQAIGYTDLEQAFTNANFATNQTRTVLWPASAIAPLPNNQGMFFSNVAQYNAAGTSKGNLYNTLITVTANDDGPSFNRTLEQAFSADDTLWGSLGSTASYIHGIVALASDEAGVKVAKVDPATYSDLSTYRFWNGSEWTSQAPAMNDTASAIIPNLNPTSADLIWSDLYNTWLLIYMSPINGFYLRYALNGAFGLTGPWSDEILVYDTTTQTPATGATYNYAGHAYTMFDSTGSSLVLSWSHGEFDENMAKVQFS
ncbi:MAG: hypothetical protein M1820_009868 [Bogoriella megaspora]|nr:MAG: hypothetical protein M1820_009868 [Bogoriella megaspora]